MTPSVLRLVPYKPPFHGLSLPTDTKSPRKVTGTISICPFVYINSHLACVVATLRETESILCMIYAVKSTESLNIYFDKVS